MKVAVLLMIANVGLLHSQEISHTTEPKVIHTVPPEYTKQALNAKLEGVVVLSALVGTDGSLAEIKLVRGLGESLDEKAVECVEQWRFSPGSTHSEPAPRKILLEVSFRLPPPPARSTNLK